jgi:hypothetical protein
MVFFAGFPKPLHGGLGRPGKLVAECHDGSVQSIGVGREIKTALTVTVDTAAVAVATAAVAAVAAAVATAAGSAVLVFVVMLSVQGLGRERVQRSAQPLTVDVDTGRCRQGGDDGVEDPSRTPSSGVAAEFAT